MGNMRQTLVPTLLVTTAMLLAAAQVDHDPMIDIVAHDPAVRRAAWDELAADGLAERLVAIHDTLAEAEPEAVVDAADRLRPVGLWGWSYQPRDLLLVELRHRAYSARSSDHRLAVSALANCPLDLETPVMLELIDQLVLSGEEDLQRRSLEVAIRWAGTSRVGSLGSLTLASDDFARLWLLALSFAPAEQQPRLPRLFLDDDADYVEAALVAYVRTSPHGLGLLQDVSHAWESEPRPAFEAIAALSQSNMTSSRRPAEDEREGDDARTLPDVDKLLVETSVEDGALAALAADEAATPTLRRLAAWRLETIDHPIVRRLLELEPADEEGRVYATALLAERHLTPTSAAATAEQWIRSSDDDRKRAGALLAALTATHGKLLARAYDAEDVAEVKRVQRLALYALGEPVDHTDALVLASRIITTGNSDFDPDVLLLLLRAGHRDSLTLLTSQPLGTDWSSWCRSVQHRRWFIERFVPLWQARAGRPRRATTRAVRLHFDDVDALRLLTERRLWFDGPTGVWTVAKQQ